MNINSNRDTFNAQVRRNAIQRSGNQRAPPGTLYSTISSRNRRDEDVDDDIEAFTSEEDIDVVANYHTAQGQPLATKSTTRRAQQEPPQSRTRPLDTAPEPTPNRSPKKSLMSIKHGDTSYESPDELDDNDTYGPPDEELEQERASQAAAHAMSALGDQPEATQPLTKAGLQLFPRDSAGYAAALDQGYHMINQKLWENEKPRRKAFENTPFPMFDHILTLVLATIPTCNLREVIGYSLAYAHLWLKKPDVVKVVKTYNSLWVLENVVVVYQITLAGPKGLSPTTHQWLQMCDLWEIYKDYDTVDPKSIEIALLIDSIGHPQHDGMRNQYGARRYILPQREERKAPDMLLPASVRYMHLRPSQESMETLDVFFAAVKRRALNSRSNEPLVMTYVGYTKNAKSRFEQHEKNPHNYLMGLSRAMAQYLFPTHKFGFRPYVIAPIASEEEAPLAEFGVCGLGSSDYRTGFGFNIADAGESNTSIFKLEQKQRVSSWAWIEKYSPRKSNMEQQVVLLEEHCRNQGTQHKEMLSAIDSTQEEIKRLSEQQGEDTLRVLAMKIRLTRQKSQLEELDIITKKIMIVKLRVENDILDDELLRMEAVNQVAAKYRSAG